MFTSDVEREEEEGDCRRESDGLECWPSGREDIDGRTWTRGEEPAGSVCVRCLFLSSFGPGLSPSAVERGLVCSVFVFGVCARAEELQRLMGSTSGNSAVKCLKELTGGVTTNK